MAGMMSNVTVETNRVGVARQTCLGSGCSLVDLQYSYAVGRPTASKNLRKQTEEMWLNIAGRFLQKANFPNCIGAVDGTHIRIVKPALVGSLYFNYTHYHSIALLGEADSNYRFIYIDVGSFGIESRHPQIPFAFVGDEAFGLQKHVLRPFSGRFLWHIKRIFKCRLSRARWYSEFTFGILPLDGNLDLFTDIVRAGCVLHNYVRSRDGYNFEDTLSIEGLEEVQDAAMDDNVNGGLQVNHIRNIWAEYFVSNVGTVPWQNNNRI
ncbi:hypothetical protein PR048_031237 [Dryococelus australis]|uniref:DDE Tnp4 domain-containing protein n=1 Tax=Dryococelus australis TaxID=614101 RepID=A0ABQ9G4P2_9NEOP|nr:hypothetical protein PR048_031237 [Dryococelus australis]